MVATRINLDCRICQYRFILTGTKEDQDKSPTFEKLRFCPSCGEDQINLMEIIDIFKEAHRNDRCQEKN